MPLSNLGRDVFFSQPGRPVPIPLSVPLLSSGNAERGSWGVRGGVRVLSGHLGPGGAQADALAQRRASLVLQRLRARHGARVGLHRNQVSHLSGGGRQDNKSVTCRMRNR